MFLKNPLKTFRTDISHFLIYIFAKQAFNSLSTNLTKWSNTLKKFVSNLTKNCVSVFDHTVGLAHKGLYI